MAKFIYNDIKNTNTSYISFKLNYDYQIRILYKDNIDFRSKSNLLDKLISKLKKLMTIYK